MITKQQWQPLLLGSLAAVQAATPKAIVEENPPPNPRYRPPPVPPNLAPEAIYFPLFEPKFPDGGQNGNSWRAYLDSRAQGGAGNVALRPVVADGVTMANLTPGLRYRSPTGGIPMIRPKPL